MTQFLVIKTVVLDQFVLVEANTKEEALENLTDGIDLDQTITDNIAIEVYTQEEVKEHFPEFLKNFKKLIKLIDWKSIDIEKVKEYINSPEGIAASKKAFKEAEKSGKRIKEAIKVPKLI